MATHAVAGQAGQSLNRVLFRAAGVHSLGGQPVKPAATAEARTIARDRFRDFMVIPPIEFHPSPPSRFFCRQ
ncbi:MAG TPA: hypothetical protein VGC53_20630 [Vicinamibacteria bacterium]